MRTFPQALVSRHRSGIEKSSSPKKNISRMVRGHHSAIICELIPLSGYFRFRNFRICEPATISSPVPSSTSELGSGVGVDAGVRLVLPVKDPRKPGAVVMISCDVRAKFAVTVGEPIVIVGPKQACAGGAPAPNTQLDAIETAVVPAGPAASVLSLRSHERKVSISPAAPTESVPDCEAESWDKPVGSIKLLTP